MAPTIEEITDQLLKLSPSQKAEITKSEKGIYLIDIAEELPYVDLKIVPSNFDHGIICLTKETKEFFPGYKEQFVLETDVKSFVMHLNGGSEHSVGDADGSYLNHPRHTEVEERLLEYAPDANTRDGTFKRFYDAHLELQPDDFITIFRASQERYILDIE